MDIDTKIREVLKAIHDDKFDEQKTLPNETRKELKNVLLMSEQDGFIAGNTSKDLIQGYKGGFVLNPTVYVTRPGLNFLGNYGKESSTTKQAADKDIKKMDKKKLRYAILKELDKDNKDIDENFFGVTESEYFDQIAFLSRENYITKPLFASNKVHSLHTVVLTEKGENYLEENNGWSKFYNTAKEIRAWIKL